VAPLPADIDDSRARLELEGHTGNIRRIALLGNHVPRQCGIATFTTDLGEALSREFSDLDCFVIAMNDAGKRYPYPSRVRFEIAENDSASYQRAADFLNVNTVDVTCVQHEYGIFGGKAGSHLLPLLRDLRMPIVTTLHTILSEPTPLQRAVLGELGRLSERIVVMSKQGAALLQSVYGLPEHKIDMIHHGIPNLVSARQSKDRLGVEGRLVILTFGLLSPDKGIETVIDALPAILERFPKALYIVLGATHPHVREHHGEMYRLMLETRAKKLGVDSHMIFHNRFVSQSELTEFLAASDVYVTPYLKPEQITSGTLAYAVGSGKATISTPYWYAKEILADNRGILVPWRDPGAIAREVISLFADEGKRREICGRAAALGREMKWPVVAGRYLETFERASSEHASRLKAAFQAKTLAARPAVLPELNLGHLGAMTDDTGILQHATFSVPSYAEGYCLDDNARGLLLMSRVEDAQIEDPGIVRALVSRYLAFVNHAYNEKLGRFRNFMTYARQWTEDCGSEDSHGRALWSLGSVVGHWNDPGRHSLANQLFHAALPAAAKFTSPRAWAFSLLGIHEYLCAFKGDIKVEAMRATLAEKLLDLFRRTNQPDWVWFEESLTYCNARLSQALVVSGDRMDNEEMTSVGLRSLEWLSSLEFSDEGYFAPVGSDGFYPRHGVRAAFDQQPVEASSMISACMESYRSTGAKRWMERAQRAFSWFLGQNQLQQALYDAATGGCRDGLHKDRVNENQGADRPCRFCLRCASCDPGSAPTSPTQPCGRSDRDGRTRVPDPISPSRQEPHFDQCRLALPGAQRFQPGSGSFA
jgi:glycosyltransferase involved in cell wall biosynthesis